MKKLFFKFTLPFCLLLLCIILQGCVTHHKPLPPQPVYMPPIYYKPKPKPYKQKPNHNRIPYRQKPFRPIYYQYDNSNLIA